LFCRSGKTPSCGCLVLLLTDSELQARKIFSGREGDPVPAKPHLIRLGCNQIESAGTGSPSRPENIYSLSKELVPRRKSTGLQHGSSQVLTLPFAPHLDVQRSLRSICALPAMPVCSLATRHCSYFQSRLHSRLRKQS